MQDTNATPTTIDAENALLRLRGVRAALSTLALAADRDFSSDLDVDCLYSLLADVTRQSVETLTDAVGVR